MDFSTLCEEDDTDSETKTVCQSWCQKCLFISEVLCVAGVVKLLLVMIFPVLFTAFKHGNDNDVYSSSYVLLLLYFYLLM